MLPGTHWIYHRVRGECAGYATEYEAKDALDIPPSTRRPLPETNNYLRVQSRKVTVEALTAWGEYNSNLKASRRYLEMYRSIDTEVSEILKLGVQPMGSYNFEARKRPMQRQCPLA